jgi:cell division protein FtsL
VVLVLGLLGGGLVCLLVVNTTLAANSIQINHLEQVNAAKTQRVEQLQQDVATAQTPTVIANEARKLGMRQQQVPAFLDLRHHSLRTGREPMR